MANRAVNIFYSVRHNGQHHRLKPVIGKNNKIKPQWAVLKGTETHLPGGSYTIGWYEGPRRVWRDCGVNPQDAVAAAERQRLFLEAARVGLPIQKEEGFRLSLSAAIHNYLAEYKLSRTDESYDLVNHTLTEFQTSCRRIHLHEITRLDLLKFADWLQRVKKNKPRTANNKFMRVHQFLKANGIELVTMKDAPKFIESRPEVYDDDQLEKFFAACSRDQLPIFKTLLMAGLRMQEAMYLQWKDVDFVHRTIAVTAKEEYGFIPKAYHERVISVPAQLRDCLEGFKPKSAGPTTLVFPTKSGKPNDKMLQACKRIARRAELSCGVCDTCVGPQKECRDWFLHKFRATFATQLLQGGMDIESVREQMGHKDVESISRYLAPLKGKAMQKKVDDVWKKPGARIGQIVIKDGKITVGTEFEE
ncbi:MAG: tyrosine-type recombinase/integrase [Acidobacteriia bacterium]|nr:tyrosine-type recombinase/integrase [Terriglobia bacterium]